MSLSLQIPCHKCDGCGMVVNPELNDYYVMNHGVNSSVPLEEEIQCNVCNGRGKILTEDGTEVVKLLLEFFEDTRKDSKITWLKLLT